MSHFTEIQSLEYGKSLHLESGRCGAFFHGIRNYGLWNLEYTLRNPESH